MSNNDTIAIPRELLEKLAPSDPMNQDEQGGCVWCDWSEEFAHYIKHPRRASKGSGYSNSNPNSHAPDCPWVLARGYLDN